MIGVGDRGWGCRRCKHIGCGSCSGRGSRWCMRKRSSGCASGGGGTGGCGVMILAEKTTEKEGRILFQVIENSKKRLATIGERPVSCSSTKGPSATHVESFTQTLFSHLLLPLTMDLSLFDSLDNRELRDHIERVGVELYRR